MPTSAAVLSSNALVGRDKEDRVDTAQSCYFAGGNAASSYTGFAKSDRDNLRRDELKAFRLLADEMLAMGDNGLPAALANGTIVEVACDG